MSLQPVSKYHSYGNDFLIADGAAFAPGQKGEFARRICRPHFGLGADGVIFVSSESGGVFRLEIFNQDGGEAGMSGNGARCAAAYLHHKGKSKEREIVFDTRSGEKRYGLVESAGMSWTYRSSLGRPRFSPEEIPCRPAGREEQIEAYELDLGKEKLIIDALSVGNPQCVVFAEELPREALFQRLGSALTGHPFFPEGTNVSFVRVDTENQISIRIWERGVGPTFSSGTGCSGAAVAALRRGQVSSPVTVRTSTGAQVVEWTPGEALYLTGESRFVADIDYYREEIL